MKPFARHIASAAISLLTLTSLSNAYTMPITDADEQVCSGVYAGSNSYINGRSIFERFLSPRLTLMSRSSDIRSFKSRPSCYGHLRVVRCQLARRPDICHRRDNASKSTILWALFASYLHLSNRKHMSVPLMRFAPICAVRLPSVSSSSTSHQARILATRPYGLRASRLAHHLAYRQTPPYGMVLEVTQPRLQTPISILTRPHG